MDSSQAVMLRISAGSTGIVSSNDDGSVLIPLSMRVWLRDRYPPVVKGRFRGTDDSWLGRPASGKRGVIRHYRKAPKHLCLLQTSQGSALSGPYGQAPLRRSTGSSLPTTEGSEGRPNNPPGGRGKGCHRRHGYRVCGAKQNSISSGPCPKRKPPVEADGGQTQFRLVTEFCGNAISVFRPPRCN